MTDPVSNFCDAAARHPRCFWLDGGGAREWSGRRSIIGWLDDDDVSLSYDAVRREVTRHVGGTSTVVGDDPFDVLAAELASKSPLVLKLGRDSFYGVWDQKAEDALRLLHPLLTVTAATEDAAEGVAAFAEKRPPVWKGR